MDKISKNKKYYYFFSPVELKNSQEISTENFVAIVYWENEKKDSFSTLAKKIIDAGAKYIMACGKNAANIEMTFDDLLVRKYIENPKENDQYLKVMTTTHENESIKNILYWADYHALPTLNTESKGNIWIISNSNDFISQFKEYLQI